MHITSVTCRVLNKSNISLFHEATLTSVFSQPAMEVITPLGSLALFCLHEAKETITCTLQPVIIVYTLKFVTKVKEFIPS